MEMLKVKQTVEFLPEGRKHNPEYNKISSAVSGQLQKGLSAGVSDKEHYMKCKGFWFDIHTVHYQTY
jgi:hypothetical protein